MQMNMEIGRDWVPQVLRGREIFVVSMGYHSFASFWWWLLEQAARQNDFLILPNLHSNAKLWFWNTSYFINPLHIQLFFNLTRLAVELMFKPVFYVYLMNLSEDITDEFGHLWIHVMVYEIKL